MQYRITDKEGNLLSSEVYHNQEDAESAADKLFPFDPNVYLTPYKYEERSIPSDSMMYAYPIFMGAGLLVVLLILILACLCK